MGISKNVNYCRWGGKRGDFKIFFASLLTIQQRYNIVIFGQISKTIFVVIF
jgi:hypothetical protein